MKTSAVRLVGLIGLAVLLAMGGCAKIKQAHRVEKSGFLPPEAYGKMTKGKEGEPALYYMARDTKWESYDKIMLDPIQIWRGKELSNIPREDVQRFANNFYIILYTELSHDYQMVDKPVLGALRLQVAITRAEERWSTLDTVSTVHPGMIISSSVKEFVTEKPSFVGEAMMEGKISDAHTGKILVAAVDRRVGGKSIDKGLDSWAAVHYAMEFWAKKLRWRLCELRKGSNCVDPEAA